MHRRTGKVALIAAILMIAGPLAVAAQASAVARTWTRSVPMTVDFSFNGQSCGARMVRGELDAGVTIDSTTGHFYFSNNAKFTHVSDSSGDLDAVLDFDAFTLRSSSGMKSLPVGGNPWIYFQVVGPEGPEAMQGGTFRCQDTLNGGSGGSISLDAETWQQLVVSGSSCNNHKNGAWLEFSLASDPSGIDVLVYLTNNKPKFDRFIEEDATSGSIPGVHVADAEGYLSLSFDGGPIVQRKGSGGPGGNPHIWAVIPDDPAIDPASGELTLDSDWYIGRCRDYR